MRCIVTAGPTFEPLDKVRRLTTFSTGRLGSELADFLTARGHSVTLLIGEQATSPGARRAERVETFTTTTDLHERLGALSRLPVEAVFHAAAVSDFRFGKVWLRAPDGELMAVNAGKISSREGTLLAELVPTAKIIAKLRAWFPQALLVGWKYEVDGNRASVVAAAQKQIAKCHTDACVANGTAYGEGFGVVTARGSLTHCRETGLLFDVLERLLSAIGRTGPEGSQVHQKE